MDSKIHLRASFIALWNTDDGGLSADGSRRFACLIVQSVVPRCRYDADGGNADRQCIIDDGLELRYHAVEGDGAVAVGTIHHRWNYSPPSPNSQPRRCHWVFPT